VSLFLGRLTKLTVELHEYMLPVGKSVFEIADLEHGDLGCLHEMFQVFLRE